MSQRRKILTEGLQRHIIFILLTGIGGFLDAYTYLLRGKVFANAQTGNLVLFGVNLLEKKILAFSYLVPVAAFLTGILTAHLLQDKYGEKYYIDWKLLILILETLAVFGIAWIKPDVKTNNVVNTFVSFITALQYGTFRTINGKPFATTMCTGMLRSGMDHFYHYCKNIQPEKEWSLAILYFFMIGIFCIGCFSGSVFAALLGQYASLICGGCFLGVIAIYIREKKKEKGKKAECANEVIVRKVETE